MIRPSMPPSWSGRVGFTSWDVVGLTAFLNPAIEIALVYVAPVIWGVCMFCVYDFNSMHRSNQG